MWAHARVGSNPTPSVERHTDARVGGLHRRSGAWLSPVERCVRVAEVPGSNPGAPIHEVDRPEKDNRPDENRRFEPRRPAGRPQCGPPGESPRPPSVARCIRAPRLVDNRGGRTPGLLRYACRPGRCCFQGSLIPSGALAEWYCTRLESERPKGLGGSNPSRSVEVPQVLRPGGLLQFRRGLAIGGNGRGFEPERGVSRTETTEDPEGTGGQSLALRV